MLVGTGGGHQAAGLYEPGQGGWKAGGTFEDRENLSEGVCRCPREWEGQPGLISAAPGPEHQQPPKLGLHRWVHVVGAPWFTPS